MTYGRGQNYTEDYLIKRAIDFISGMGVNVFGSCLFYSARHGGNNTTSAMDSKWDYGYVF
jgi:pectin methylesterase-like acyl-CoA thioesterase